MIKGVAVFCVFIVLGGAGLFGYGVHLKKKNAVAEIARAHKLSGNQEIALGTCLDQLHGIAFKKATDYEASGSVCACHVRKMVQVMKPGEYSSHENVVKHLAANNQSNFKFLEPTQVSSRYTPKRGFSILHRSLTNCMQDFYNKSMIKVKKMVCHQKRYANHPKLKGLCPRIR